MATQTRSATEPKSDAVVQQKVEKLRELYADAPEVGKSRAGERAPRRSRKSWQRRRGRNRRPDRRPSGQGLGAHRVPSVRERGSEAASRPAAVAGRELPGGGRGGTVHDMRFVFLDNDTKLLFATAYDGDFDPYIETSRRRFPNALDLWLSNFEGYPGMRSPCGEGLDRQAPDRGRGLVRQQSEPDGGGDAKARARRQGG